MKSLCKQLRGTTPVNDTRNADDAVSFRLLKALAFDNNFSALKQDAYGCVAFV